MSISGAYLEASINGVAVNGLHEWEADDSGGDVLDATHGGTGGSTDTDVGCKDLRVTLRMIFDVADGIDVDLRFGTILTSVLLYRHQGDSSPAYELPSAIVVGKPTTVPVRGRIEMTATIKNKGAFTENLY